MTEKDPWVIVPAPGFNGYFSLVRGYGNDTEWCCDGPYGGEDNPARWAFHELAEEKRLELSEP